MVFNRVIRYFRTEIPGCMVVKHTFSFATPPIGSNLNYVF